MALKQCPECKKEVSSTAELCPHCGYKLRKTSGCVTMIAAFFFLILLVLVVMALLKIIAA
jgi:predicted amidophosphoribosyltransferase